MVVVPLVPCAKARVPGVAVSLKLPKPSTVSVSVAFAVWLPETPLIVTVTFPFVAVALAVNVSVLVLVAGLGSKDAVTPLGNPEAENVTFPLKPFAGVMVIVLFPSLPCLMVRLLGPAESV